LNKKPAGGVGSVTRNGEEHEKRVTEAQRVVTVRQAEANAKAMTYVMGVNNTMKGNLEKIADNMNRSSEANTAFLSTFLSTFTSEVSTLRVQLGRNENDMERVKSDVGGIRTDVSSLTATMKGAAADAVKERAEERNAEEQKRAEEQNTEERKRAEERSTERAEWAEEQRRAGEQSAATLKNFETTMMNAIT